MQVICTSMSECSPVFSEETLVVSFNLLLGLIIDLLFGLSVTEIVPQLPVKATSTTSRTATQPNAQQWRIEKLLVEEHVKCNYFRASLHLLRLQHQWQIQLGAGLEGATQLQLTSPCWQTENTDDRHGSTFIIHYLVWLWINIQSTLLHFVKIAVFRREVLAFHMLSITHH